MSAGYSKRSLPEKLGIKEQTAICILNQPENYNETLGQLPPRVTILSELHSNLRFIHFFTKSSEELNHLFPLLKRSLAKDGMLWISWPKSASKIKTDLNENKIREIGLEHGLVDVKVCAVDEVWSGLKFVYRIKDR